MACCGGHGHGPHRNESLSSAQAPRAKPRAISAVLCDLSGTIHVQDKPIPGAVDAMRKLVDSGIRVRFCTNTTKQSGDSLYNELRAMGFPIERKQILSSPLACRKLLEREGLRPYLIIDPRLAPDFEGLNTADSNAVLVGLAPSECHYGKLNEAFRLLMGGAKLIAMHKGKYYREKEELSLGPGPFVAALEYATGAKAVVVGKPSPDFFEAALADMGARAGEAVVVGDDLQDDVLGAMALGARGVLVRTGKFLPADEAPAAAAGARVVPDFAAFVDWLLAHNAAIAAAEAIGESAVIAATTAALGGAGPGALLAALPGCAPGSPGDLLWGPLVVETAGLWALEKGEREREAAAGLVAGLAGGEGAALASESVAEGVARLLAVCDDLCIEVPAAYPGAEAFVAQLVARGALKGAALQRALQPLVRIGESDRFLAAVLTSVRSSLGDAGLRERCAGLELAAVLAPSIPRHAAAAQFLQANQLWCLDGELALEARAGEMVAAGTPLEAVGEWLSQEGLPADRPELHSRLLHLFLHAGAAREGTRREAALKPPAPAELDRSLYARFGPHLTVD
eukprot:tig00001234_g7744.t1